MALNFTWSFFAWFCLVFAGTSLKAEGASVSICLHHRKASLDFKDSVSFRKWIVPNHFRDMGKGIFGHAWLFIQPPFDRKEQPFEIGHTGENDLQEKTYLESFIDEAARNTGEPLRVFFEDRWDGFLEKNSGGHIPDEVWTLSLSDEQYDSLIYWIHSGRYDFRRYNLALHQCCHFVLEALKWLSIEISSPSPTVFPKKVYIWNWNIQLWRSSEWKEILWWTPFELSVSFAKDGRFKKTTESYFLAKREVFSINPLIRFWQKREHVKALFVHGFSQIQREAWVLGFRSDFED